MSDLHTEIINTTRALIVVLDAGGRIVMFNPACECLSGYRFAEVQGRPIWDFLLPPEEIEGVKAVFADLRAGHFPNTHEGHWITKFGERRFIEWSNSAATDESGSVIHIIGTGIDVTEKRAAERAIEEGEERFRHLAENIPLVFWVREVPGNRVSYVSPAYEQVWGRKLGGFDEAYQSFMQSIHPDDREALFRQMQRESGDSARTDSEYRIIRPDGEVRWIHSRAIPIQDETGQVQRILGFAEDITERKNADLAFRERSYLLSESQRVGHIGSWSADTATGNISWSDETYRIYGVSPHTFVLNNKNFLDLIHPGDRARMQEWIGACAAGEEPGDLEFRINSADGEIRILRGRGGLLHPAGAATPRMVGAVQDITQLKRAEQVAHETMQREKVLLDSIPDAAWLVDAGGRFIAVNRNYAERWGFDGSDAVGKTISEVLPASFAEERVAENREVMHAAKPLHIERRHLIDGRECWFDVTKTPIFGDAGDVIGLACISRDITERKTAEAQRMARDASLRAALIKEVHHRIKNNLQGVITFIQQLAFHHAENASLVDAVISRVNAVGSVHGLFGAFGENDHLLEHIVQTLVSSLKVINPILPVRLSIRSSRESVRVTARETVPLALIVNELLTNAIKHSRSTESNPVEITLESTGSRAGIVIAAQGAQFPRQFDFATGAGLGAGLALVKSMLPPAGAELRFDNVADPLGTKVELTLRPPVISS